MAITPDKAMEDLLALYKQYQTCTGGRPEKASKVFLRCVNDKLTIEAKPRWGLGWTAKLRIWCRGERGQYDFQANAEKFKKIFYVALAQPLPSLEGMKREGADELEKLAKDFGTLTAHVMGKKSSSTYTKIAEDCYIRQKLIDDFIGPAEHTLIYCHPSAKQDVTELLNRYRAGIEHLYDDYVASKMVSGGLQVTPRELQVMLKRCQEHFSNSCGFIEEVRGRMASGKWIGSEEVNAAFNEALSLYKQASSLAVDEKFYKDLSAIRQDLRQLSRQLSRTQILADDAITSQLNDINNSLRALGNR